MKSFKYLAIISISLSCSGAPLITNPDADSTTLKEVTLSSTQYGTPDAEGHFPDYLLPDLTKQFVTKDGITIKLQKALISWGHFHLISDGSDDECIPGTTSELELETIQDVLSEDGHAHELASGTIADVSFCQYELHLTNDNASFDINADHEDILGATLYVSGAWDNGIKSTPFEITLDDEIEINGPFMAGSLLDASEHPLHFHGDDTHKKIILGFAYDTWFDDIDFDGSANDIKNQLESNVIASFSQFLDTH